MADRAAILAELNRRGQLPAQYRGEFERLSQSGALGKKAGSASNTNFDNASSLRKEFSGRQEVKDFTAVLPIFSSAISAPNTAAGDLSLIYAMGKVMDPGSVVREGELSLAQSTGGLGDKLQALAQNVQTGQRLTPAMRRNLQMAIRQRAQMLGEAYAGVRGDFKQRAERFGFDPIDIVGSHPAAPFQQVEANFLGRPVRNRDGSTGAAPARRAVQPPRVGTVRGGYRYKGGDPASPASWQKVQ